MLVMTIPLHFLMNLVVCIVCGTFTHVGCRRPQVLGWAGKKMISLYCVFHCVSEMGLIT